MALGWRDGVSLFLYGMLDKNLFHTEMEQTFAN
jgi:hypothetical protein